MKFATYFIVFFYFIQKMKVQEVATFKCELTVQKIRKQGDETIIELHERLRKESDGENMLQKYRILEEKKKMSIKEEENDQSNSSEDDEKSSDENNSEEENEQTQKIDDDDHEIVIKDLKENKELNKTENEENKSQYIHDLEGYQYLNYFKCVAKGSYYRKEVSFKVNCQKQSDIEIYIYKGDKIAKKIHYKFKNFFSSTDSLDEKESVLPEIGFNFDNPEDFIIFKPDDDNCILRISKAFKFSILVGLVIFFINF